MKRGLPVAAMGMYRLEGRTPVLIEVLTDDDANIWRDENRRVAEDTVGEAWISTVFLVIDHRHGFPPLESSRPVLWETMIFDGPFDNYTWRYTSWEDAEKGHRNIVRCLQEGRDPDAAG